MPPAVAAAVGVAAVGSAVSAKLQSDAANKARKDRRRAEDRAVDLQERQFALSRELIERGIGAFDEASGIAGFDPIENARERFQQANRLLNEELARTGSLDSGGGADFKLRNASNILREEQQRLFSNQLSLAQLGTGQGLTAQSQGNSLFSPIASFGQQANQAGLAGAGVVGGAVQGIGGLGLQGLALQGLLGQGGGAITSSLGPGSAGSSINQIFQAGGFS